jgi:hypothetical protein
MNQGRMTSGSTAPRKVIDVLLGAFVLAVILVLVGLLFYQIFSGDGPLTALTAALIFYGAAMIISHNVADAVGRLARIDSSWRGRLIHLAAEIIAFIMLVTAVGTPVLWLAGNSLGTAAVDLVRLSMVVGPIYPVVRLIKNL